MPPLDLLGFSLLPPLRSGAALSAGLTLHTHVLLSFALLVDSSILIHRIADSVIGLSCIALAASLGSFLLSAGKDLPFRWTVIAVTLCTTIAGVVSLLSAAGSTGDHLHPADKTPFVVAALLLAAASLLPLLLPLLLSKSRELESASVASRRNEVRFYAAAESSNDAFILLDALRSPDGRIEDFLFTYLNANAEKIILKQTSQVVGARITRILPIDPAGKLFEQYRQVVLTGTPLIHEFPLHRNDPYGPWMRHQVAKLDDGLAITASDITERKHADHNLLNQAQHDALTGLPNRRLLNDRIEQAIARADRYQNKVATLLVNLDGFQQVNDLYGRSVGDEVILVIAARLRGAIRATDTVIRLGGDEFILVMPDMTLEVDIRRTAATLVAIIREPLTLPGKDLRIACSVGVTIYPDTALTIQELLTGADLAMCRAKAQGHNVYVLYNPVTDSRFVPHARHSLDPSSDADAEQCAD